jgi:hypothetical protein
MTGLDNSGRLTTLWWAPELGPGNWEVSFIGEGQTAWDTGVAIDSWFNQPTQSLNFVGTNESGRVTVYTWSVSNQTWRAEYPGERRDGPAGPPLRTRSLLAESPAASSASTTPTTSSGPTAIPTPGSASI